MLLSLLGFPGCIFQGYSPIPQSSSSCNCRCFRDEDTGLAWPPLEEDASFSGLPRALVPPLGWTRETQFPEGNTDETAPAASSPPRRGSASTLSRECRETILGDASQGLALSFLICVTNQAPQGKRKEAKPPA